MSEEVNFFEQVSAIVELNTISEHLNDENVDEALTVLVKLIAKPSVPVNTAAPLIVKLQALSIEFKLKAKHYMLFDKSVENKEKKNIYMTLSESLKELSDALKYLIRANN